jgi:hypothetical protein
MQSARSFLTHACLSETLTFMYYKIMDYVLFACPTQENTYKLKLAAYTFATLQPPFHINRQGSLAHYLCSLFILFIGTVEWSNNF